LMVEECVRAHLDQAAMLGADLRFNEPVVSWSADGNGVVVDTIAGRYSAGHLVIAAGAWSSNLVAGLGLPLRVVRKHLHWFSNHDERYRVRNGCPAFFFELADGCFYGFPEMGGSDLGVKVAEHSGGENVLDPSSLDRSIDAQDRGRVVEILGRCTPTVSTRSTYHSVCMYTLSPDEHFILDFHPDHPQVCFAAGLSGHGFKLAPVLGEALSELSLNGGTQHEVEFLSLSRFGQGPIHKA
jgi:sarcosine oxidase